MRKAVGLLLVFAISVSAFGIVEGNEVMYKGGTVSNLREGVIGHFDTSSQSAITFQADGTRLVIPYDKIRSYQYSHPVARHYGVLLTVAVVLLKFRQRRHYVKVTYSDDKDTEQVAIFEVPKTMPITLMPILSTRAPQGCRNDSFAYDSGVGSCDLRTH
ncbi:MAG TPA: hypothetical protein VF135_14825 [Terriglobales bacterium]